MNSKDGEKDGIHGDLAEELESFKNLLEIEYKQRIAEANKTREETLKKIQEMYDKRMELFRQKLKKEEEALLLQARELETKYQDLAKDMTGKIDKPGLIDAIISEISQDLWPNLDRGSGEEGNIEDWKRGMNEI
ncbi:MULTISPECIES: hypothetical protein [Acetomicrobium]|uniref:Uncharacterized protein n=1 Tax=Acetomicrobium hydrogeniformans TaxID=649746 RepID=A0A7V7BY96_9BACT|nr:MULTISPECIES: hypothetical protein [Acetomicrobium]HHZ03942.1 hypothetical protein [Acetomicrobium hydrogeniformans]